MSGNPLLIILGPTASGKTRLAAQLAHRFNGELISGDSRQVFRDMDLGTGKDLHEYLIDGRSVPYHLINILPAGAKYNVNAFKDDFYAAFEGIVSRERLPVLCGGSGMYIHSILQQQDYTAVPVNQELRDRLMLFTKSELIQQLQQYPENLTAHADTSSHKRLIRAIEVAKYLQSNQLVQAVRPEIDPFIIGIDVPRPVLRDRIYLRLRQRLDKGLIEEVERLLKQGVSPEMLSFYGLEYKFVMDYLNGVLHLEQMEDRLFTAICQFAKRQVTFFRKMEKDGVKINWINGECEFDILMENVLSLKEIPIKGYN